MIHSCNIFLNNKLNLFVSLSINLIQTARRRAAAKRKKLKNLGKSKSTDTEEEDADDDCGDDGELQDYLIPKEKRNVLES